MLTVIVGIVLNLYRINNKSQLQINLIQSIVVLVEGVVAYGPLDRQLIPTNH